MPFAWENFGAPTPFKANAAELRAAELAEEVAALRKQLSTAKAAKAVAEQREAVALRCFGTELQRNRSMDDWDRAAELQQQLDVLKEDNKDIRSQLSAVTGHLQGKEADIAYKDNEISSLTTDKDQLKASLADVKQKLDEQLEASQEIDSHLNNAYADLGREQTAHKATVKAKDDAEAKLKETEGELHSLHTQWEELQNRVQELEAQTAEMQDLEREHQALQDDIENLRNQLGSHDRTILVKDARIQHLETQYQKALEGKLNAEAAANAAAAPTSVPTFTAGDESLEDELANTAGFEDNGSEFEQLDYSGITEIADIAPIEPAAAPKLSIGVVQAASVAPVAAQTDTSSTQTDERQISTTSAQTDECQTTTSYTQTDAPEKRAIAAQTDTPKLSAGVIHAASIHVPPIEPKKALTTTATQTDVVPVEAEKTVSTTATQTDHLRDLKTTAAQTDVSNPLIRKSRVSTVLNIWPIADNTTAETTTATAATQTEKTAEKSPERIITVTTSSKRSVLERYYPLISALIVFFCFMAYAMLEAWKVESGYYYSHNDFSYGAFGNGRYLFGFFPIGFDIGHSRLSEEICRHTSTAIAVFEDWAGITPTPMY
ncbi:hypothetical protein BU26DRAFT_516787 [Trematosphaeria pertusa]|uniref:Uncharacterized protein n=1 Tax=Trematosphaeria pertusa TaxID=390896 RepID=A0A6A6IPB5_9PLEO|nr:uncharacterized protein BU26DRAFT_516787 [Trematosphaeria pertusa]KAF2252089.1 hypothetical protein BU26DRAFT_516787 [Trematosphaeria pertusa]